MSRLYNRSGHHVCLHSSPYSPHVKIWYTHKKMCHNFLIFAQHNSSLTWKFCTCTTRCCPILVYNVGMHLLCYLFDSLIVNPRVAAGFRRICTYVELCGLGWEFRTNADSWIIRISGGLLRNNMNKYRLVLPCANYCVLMWTFAILVDFGGLMRPYGCFMAFCGLLRTNEALSKLLRMNAALCRLILTKVDYCRLGAKLCGLMWSLPSLTHGVNSCHGPLYWTSETNDESNLTHEVTDMVFMTSYCPVSYYDATEN